MSRHPPSNIRASVHFADSTVFAGEDVACTITFKNIAREQGADRESSRSPQYNGTPAGDRSRKVTPLQPQGRPPASRDSSYGPNIPPHMRKGHRPANSLGQISASGESHAGGGSRQRHGRSLSIISMGTDAGTVVSMPSRGGQEGAWKSRGPHERTNSVQTAPRRGSNARQTSAQNNGQGSPRITVPVITEQSNDSASSTRQSRSPGNRPASIVVKTPGIMQQNFKFPIVVPPERDASEDSRPDPESAVSPRTESQLFGSLSPLPSEANPLARVISQSSANGSTRSSLDLFSEIMSNHSDETSMSEYVPQQMARFLPRPSHARNQSRLGMREPPRGPETIMMGYAQIMGSFTLEGSLVNQAPFEEVKRKGVVGSHGGGGVVGVERTKRESGLFGSFGWGNIGESLGGLLGGGEMSSIKEMRGIAKTKTIPLVTTPPSILFVDLTLAPGESRSYSFRFTLPRGLPPTHKGRAIKVSYQLVIGTQRSSAGKDQQLRSIDVPFRIFGSVNHRGEVLGHDLMSPYILLKDQAKTSAMSLEPSEPEVKPKKPPDQKGEGDFLSYIDALLDKSVNGEPALLSPTSPLSPGSAFASRRHSSVAESLPQDQLEIIDLAILRSNHLDQSKSSNGSSTAPSLSNRFNISRSGLRVATLYITRPAYRLGETVHLIADFKNADVPTYAIQVALETRETVDAAIAMRSASSIYRYTRKVHAFDSANALFARRLSFALGVPGNATPEFMTSGIALDWRLRIEFVTPRLAGVEKDELKEAFQLLEEVARDDRGAVKQGVEGLRVESFEVAVPIRIFGGPSGNLVGEWNVDDVPV